MKIIYIHQYFKTPQEAGGTRSYWIARELLRRGHEVTVISATNEETRTEVIDGINVEYIHNFYDNRLSALQKVKSFARFILQSIAKAKQHAKNADIVFATSTPLTVGAVALWLKRRHGIRYIFEVRDLWPEFPIQIGAIRNRVFIKILRRLEKNIYKKAEHIIALSPGMKEGVEAAGVPSSKVTMIPNMSKPDLFYPREKNPKTLEQFNIDPRKFNIIHFGAMGRANGLEYILSTAKILKDKGIDDVNFIFLGKGAVKKPLQQEVEKYNLDNVTFIDPQPLDMVSEIVNCCDLSVTTFLDLPVLQTNSPNKLFDSLSAAKPVAVNSRGWTKDLVENENCGFFAEPTDPNDFANKIIKFKNDEKTLRTWAENARKVSEEKFDKDILASQAAQVIEFYTNF